MGRDAVTARLVHPGIEQPAESRNMSDSGEVPRARRDEIGRRTLRASQSGGWPAGHVPQGSSIQHAPASRSHLLSAQQRCVEVVAEPAMQARSAAALLAAFDLFAALNALVRGGSGSGDATGALQPAPRPRWPAEGSLGLCVNHNCVDGGNCDFDGFVEGQWAWPQRREDGRCRGASGT